MVKYESIFITDPAATDDEVGTLVKGFEDSVTASQGQVIRVERWGKRRLAYRVGRHEEGHYTLMLLEAPAPAVRELERRYRMNDRIIKYMTVRLDKNVPDSPPAPAETPGVEEKPAGAAETE